MLKKLLIISLLISSVFAEDSPSKTSDNDDISFRAMPTLSSNPTAGTGVGAMGIMVYKVDKDSSPSQFILMGQYTNTDSYNVIAVNKMFFSNDDYQSNTVVGTLFNNSEFDTGAIDIPFLPPEETANFDVTMFFAVEQVLYQLVENVYIGGQIFYVGQNFNALNDAGIAFMALNGIVDSSRVGVGGTISYDTRTKQEKFYPRDSQFVNLAFNDFPEALGTDIHFYNVNLNARHYQHGFKDDDVLALQLYAQYSSEDTPDGALSALGARNILRGFSIGQYKARNMIAGQGEYRYQITNTDFRLAAFAGYANLSGGSAGTDKGNRDSNNGDYYSGGFGARYTIQKKQGIDFRVDYAVTNTGDYAINANINQAF